MFFCGDKEAVKATMFDIGIMTSDLRVPEQEEEQIEPATQIFPGHDVLCSRVEKTLYYGRLPSTDRPSLPLTQIAVDQFAGVGLEKLARLDMARAADMAKDAYAGPTSLVLALIYLDRLKKQNPDYLKTISSADLFLVSIMVASKFLHDDGEEDEVFNDEWAKAGNIDVKEFNRLEVEFLSAIDWRVNVPASDFDSTLETIEKEIAFRQMTDRGWASYTDLCVLSHNPQVEQLWKMLTETSIKVTAVCMAAYAASLLTLLGTATMLNQTPFGPTAISQSLRTLRAGHRQPQPVPESDRNVTTAAELLTASLLVTTLTASADEPDIQFNTESSAFGIGYDDHQVPTTGSRLNDTAGDLLGSGGLDPPEWLVDRSAFIHHATANFDDYDARPPSLPNYRGDQDSPGIHGIKGNQGDRVDDFLRTLGIEWSKNVLRDYGEPAQPTDSQCPFLRWGSVSFFQPNQLSILV